MKEFEVSLSLPPHVVEFLCGYAGIKPSLLSIQPSVSILSIAGVNWSMMQQLEQALVQAKDIWWPRFSQMRISQIEQTPQGLLAPLVPEDEFVARALASELVRLLTLNGVSQWSMIPDQLCAVLVSNDTELPQIGAVRHLSPDEQAGHSFTPQNLVLYDFRVCAAGKQVKYSASTPPPRYDTRMRLHEAPSSLVSDSPLAIQ